MRRDFEKEKKEMQIQMESMEIENKKLLDTLIRHSKGKKENQ